MAESKTTAGQRTRRSTATSRKLEAARERLARQLAEEREREERIKQALRDYIAAGEKIAAAEEACAEKVVELENRIERLREQAREKVAGAHAQQARSALAMHDAGRTVEQVADLLAVSEKKARQLIASGRETVKEVDSRPLRKKVSGVVVDTPAPEAEAPASSGAGMDAWASGSA